ncbi:Uncharacterised protein [Mycobacteroides abscessus subsp. abscessus]|nr:Uncharacterised protein [Mycobacteroides abscessus subsp. abscessus]
MPGIFATAICISSSVGAVTEIDMVAETSRGSVRGELDISLTVRANCPSRVIERHICALALRTARRLGVGSGRTSTRARRPDLRRSR